MISSKEEIFPKVMKMFWNVLIFLILPFLGVLVPLSKWLKVDLSVHLCSVVALLSLSNKATGLSSSPERLSHYSWLAVQYGAVLWEVLFFRIGYIKASLLLKWMQELFRFKVIKIIKYRLYEKYSIHIFQLSLLYCFFLIILNSGPI